MEDVVEKLKEMIEDKGPGYLSGEPYKVYKKLLKDRVTEKKMADKPAAIVLSLYSQENEDEPDSVRKWLKY